MELAYHVIEHIVEQVIQWAILLLESIGAGIIIAAGILGFISYIRRNPYTKLQLAKGLAAGLEFKLGSEILRTVIVREWSEIGIVAGIIVLRAALTFLIHWEIREEKKDCRKPL